MNCLFSCRSSLLLFLPPVTRVFCIDLRWEDRGREDGFAARLKKKLLPMHQPLPHPKQPLPLRVTLVSCRKENVLDSPSRGEWRVGQ